ncbi:PREDICTED: stellacyanin [Nicotiana attenuata]|uniref:Early nodulin-like protein 1 n=1 Tax=Nicotiana attenuata TaxID=49451 RepID=A0A1J6KC14_NICAT|nr:PREDICTED: stellacyanin [Nicotiana attenuata]OIT20363.1 early nodulin-like protein 1 [Nicotiana attenuata]
MATLSIPRKYHSLYIIFQFFLLIQTKVLCYQYKVGDLSAWNVPSSANKDVYTKWSKNHVFKIGDSIMFLYPPSEDSVIQVTKQNYNSCNLKNPILYMNNGNSLFNITRPGEFYFTSGAEGHCEKSQKLHISIPGGNGTTYEEDSPAFAPSADSPAYPTVFGSIPVQSANQSSSGKLHISIFGAIGSVFLTLLLGSTIF